MIPQLLLTVLWTPLYPRVLFSMRAIMLVMVRLLVSPAPGWQFTVSISALVLVTARILLLPLQSTVLLATLAIPVLASMRMFPESTCATSIV